MAKGTKKTRVEVKPPGDEIDRFFALAEAGTTKGREVRAGLATFLTMAYIIFLNPAILSHAGMDFGAVFVATCLAAAAGSALMGLLANYPIALAPGMGLNAYFAYTAVPAMGGSWQIALGCVFMSGVLFLALSLTPFREWLINAVPKDLKLGIAAGIGLFLAIIGLQNAGIIQDHPTTLVTLGDFSEPTTAFACIGFLLIVYLYACGVSGALLIGIGAITLVAIFTGQQAPMLYAAAPPSIAPTFLRMEFESVFAPGLIGVVFTFLLIDILDTAGTLIAVGHQGGLLDADGKLPRLRRALLADSGATVLGAMLGTSTTTSYIESAAGIQEGGRTGLTSLTVAGLFVAAIALAPIAKSVPLFATAPALVFVACLLLASLKDVNWDDATDFVPVAVIVIAMPLTFSITAGIGLGFITHCVVKAASGRMAELNWAVALIAAMFVAMLAFG